MQIVEDRVGRGERIEANGVGHVPRPAGIGRQDQRHPAVGGACPGQTMPTRHTVGDGRDPVRCRGVGSARELQVGVAGGGFLERGHAGQDPPVDLGQDDVHGQIGGRQASCRPGPGRLCRGGQRHLEDRHPGGIERRSRSLAASGEGRRVHDDGRREMRHLSRQPCPRARRLERRREQPQDPELPRTKSAEQSLDRRGIGGDEVGAVEDHESEGGGVLKPGGDRASDPVLGRPGAHFGQRLGALHGLDIKTRRERHLRQRRLCRHRASGVAKMGEAAQRGGRDGRDGVEPRIGPPVPGQDGKRDGPFPRQRLDLLQSIGPVRHAADQPDQDPLRSAQRLLDIGIDRKRVLEGRQIGQPQRGKPPLAPAAPVPARRKGAKVAVGQRQDHQIGGALPQVDRRLGVVKAVAFAEDDVHPV
jgi:hypothetical protein